MIDLDELQPIGENQRDRDFLRLFYDKILFLLFNLPAPFLNCSFPAKGVIQDVISLLRTGERRRRAGSLQPFFELTIMLREHQSFAWHLLQYERAFGPKKVAGRP
jgi:hypothetical protein